jgi:hypothetical protein
VPWIVVLVVEQVLRVEAAADGRVEREAERSRQRSAAATVGQRLVAHGVDPLADAVEQRTVALVEPPRILWVIPALITYGA